MRALVSELVTRVLALDRDIVMDSVSGYVGQLLVVNLPPSSDRRRNPRTCTDAVSRFDAW